MEHQADLKTYTLILFLGIQVGALITGILWALSNGNELKDYTNKLKKNGKEKI
jgi:hypothetical protein